MQSLQSINNYSDAGKQQMILTGWNYLGEMYDAFFEQSDASFSFHLPVSTVMWLSRAKHENTVAIVTGMFVHAAEHGVVTISGIAEKVSEEISDSVKICRRCPKLLADEPAGAEHVLLRSVYDYTATHKNPTVVAVLLARTLAEFSTVKKLPRYEQEAFLQTAQARARMHIGVIQSGYFLVEELSKKIADLQRTLSQ